MNFQSDTHEQDNRHASMPRQARAKNLAERDVNARRRCSLCEKKFEAVTSPCLPFCSTRCQQLDLQKWMTEGYGLPLDGHEDVEHGAVDE